MCQAFSRDFPGDSAVKNPHAMKETCTGDASFIPGLGRFPGEANGKSLQYSCLENSVERGAWWAIVHGVSKSWRNQPPWLQVILQSYKSSRQYGSDAKTEI